MGRHLPPELLGAVATYLALRVLMLVTAFDESAMHAYELYPMGTIPVVLLEGVDVPLRFSYDNAAGQLVVGVLAVPFYAVLGPKYLALKLVPLLLGLGALLLAWSFARDAFGRLAGGLAAWLFALGPTTAVKYSLMASGNHFENLFFTMLAVWAAFRAHRRPSPARLLGAGLAAGLAIFVFLGAITPVGLLALVHLGRRGWRGTLRDLPAAGGGFLAGILPLVAINWTTGARGASFLDAKFGGEGYASPARVAERLGAFFTEHLPRASCFEPLLGVDGAWADRLLLLAFATAWLLALPPAARAAARLVRGALRAEGSTGAGEALVSDALLVLVAYLPLTGLAFGLSDLVVGNHAPPLEVAGYRYFLPHFLLSALLIGWAAERLRAWRGPAAAALVAGPALVAGLFDAALVDPGFARAGTGFHYEGYNFKSASKALLGAKNGLTQPEVVEHARRYPPPHRQELYVGFGFHHALKTTQRTPAPASPDVAAVLAGYPAEFAPELARGVGHYLRELTRYVPDRAPDVRAQLVAWHAAGEPWLDDVVDGFNQHWDFLLESRSAAHLAENEEWRRGMPLELHDAFARGQGRQAGRLLRRGIASERERVAAVLAGLEPARRPAFLAGLGRGLADGGRRPELPGDLATVVPDPAERARVEAAFAAAAQRVFGAP